MATYVSLVNWTEQGIKNFPDTIRRAEEFSRWVTGRRVARGNLTPGLPQNGA